MNNPLSAYDFVYKTMTNEERFDMRIKIDDIMLSSVAKAVATMKSAMENALWNKLLASKPDDLESYQISQLVEAWQKNYPEQFKAVVDMELQKRIKQLEELAEFNNRMRENRY